MQLTLSTPPGTKVVCIREDIIQSLVKGAVYTVSEMLRHPSWNYHSAIAGVMIEECQNRQTDCGGWALDRFAIAVDFIANERKV